MDVPGVLQKYGDKIVPDILILLCRKGLQEGWRQAIALRPRNQGATAIGIESPAIDGILVERPVAGNVQIEQSFRLQNSQHFKEQKPKHLGMLKTRATNNDIDTLVAEWKFIGIIQNNVHAFTGNKVNAYVCERCRAHILERPIDVLTTDVHNNRIGEVATINIEKLFTGN
jgi:hypothetical protein